MSLINRAIANLFSGISQQPAQLRHVTQCETLENGFPSIATGLRRRPPTKHIAKLTSTTSDTTFVHMINRDSATRYLVVLRSGVCEVYNLATGAAQTVLTPDGVGYLTSTTPRDDFAAVTVADYTFIVNKTKVAALTATVGGGTVLGTKQVFSALPAVPAVNDIYKIQGNPDSAFTTYYVKWDGNVWVETVNPGQTDDIDATTMPFTLTKTGASTFTFAKATWPSRLTGDLLSSPSPSFIGHTIKDVFFYRNRVGVISDEGTILSRAGEPFTFWPESITAVLDSDPVDVKVNSAAVALLNSAVPFNKDLMLFSENAQFQFTAGDVLTPKTGRIDLVTSFQASSGCRPVGSGQQLFFPVDLVDSAAIYEYYVDSNTLSNTAASINAHAPTYIPKNVFKLASCTSEDVLLTLTLNQRNKIVVYKYFWNGTTKVQSALGTFIFDAADVILFAEFINNIAYFVIQRADGMFLESMSFAASATDTDVGFLVGLDRRVSLTGVYDAGNNWTTWTLPYVDAGAFTVVLGGTFTDAGVDVPTTRPSTTTIRTTGDYSAGACYIGRQYKLKLTLSEQFVRDQKDVAVTAGKLKLRRMFVNYSNTGYFRAEVTPKARSTYTYEYVGKEVGEATLGAIEIHSGTLSVPVMAGSEGLTISLVSDNYLPCNLQSVEWEGEFILKSSRTG